MPFAPRVWLGVVAAVALAACNDRPVAPEPTAQPAAQTTSNLAAGAGPSAGAVPTARAPAQVREALDTLLGGREFIPTREQLDRAGPPDQVAAYLREAAGDGGRRLQHRAQALALLRFYPDDRTYAVYDRLLEDGDADPVLVRTSVQSAGEAFGARGVPLLRKALNGKDDVVRESAVRNLAKLQTPEARAALEAHLPAERDPRIAGRVREALNQPR